MGPRDPRDPRGVKKSDFTFLQIKLLRFCATIAPKRHKHQKIVKIEKKVKKNLVFLEYFEYSSIWGQYLHTKPQMACLVDPGASFDTPGTPGGRSPCRIYQGFSICF